MARIPAPRDVSGARGGGGGGGVHITTRAHIASDMGPGKGSRIPRDMGPPGTISLAIWYRGGSTKGGGPISLLHRHRNLSAIALSVTNRCNFTTKLMRPYISRVNRDADDS